MPSCLFPKGLGIASSIWQAIEAVKAHDRYEATHDANEREAAASDVRGARARAIGLGIASGTLALSGLAVLMFAEP